VAADVSAGDRHRLEIHHWQERRLDASETIEILGQRNAFRLIDFDRHFGDEFIELRIGIAVALGSGPFDDASVV